jgi:hypothetical protein
VLEGSVKSGGLFAASYLLYKVKTEGDSVDYTIHRKDADFYLLRKILLKNFPYHIVPPLPAKKKKETEKAIKKREKYLTRFMSAISRCEQFKSSPFLIEWLKNDDIKDFQKVIKAADK